MGLAADADVEKLANDTIEAIFIEKLAAHRMTLRHTKANGAQKWTLFEAWPAMDFATPQRAILISTLNMTHQHELEAQLDKAREQLLRCAGRRTGNRHGQNHHLWARRRATINPACGFAQFHLERLRLLLDYQSQ